MTSIKELALEQEDKITSLEDENSRLKGENLEIKHNFDNLSNAYSRLTEAAGRALAERDYYMRECAELTAKFTTFAALAREALDTHRMAPFRPNGAAPPDEPAKASEEGIKAIAEANRIDDAIPAFLTKPNQEPAKIVGPLKLRRKV